MLAPSIIQGIVLKKRHRWLSSQHSSERKKAHNLESSEIGTEIGGAYREYSDILDVGENIFT